ncbi:hypothetical protein, partial [Roseofilum casamattae]
TTPQPNLQREELSTSAGAETGATNPQPNLQREELSPSAGAETGATNPQPNLQREELSTSAGAETGATNPQPNLQREELSTSAGAETGETRTQPNLQREELSPSAGAETGETRTQPNLQREELSTSDNTPPSAGAETGATRTQPNLQREELSTSAGAETGATRTQPNLQREVLSTSVETLSSNLEGLSSVQPRVARKLPERGDMSQDISPERSNSFVSAMGNTGRQNEAMNVKKSMLFPPGISMGAKGDVSSSDFTNQPKDLKALIQQSLKAKSELKEKLDRRKAVQVKPIAPNEIGLYNTLQGVKQEEKEEEKEEDKTDNVELLAREIYQLVRQRFQIEQERYGPSYSGRLPW